MHSNMSLLDRQTLINIFSFFMKRKRKENPESFGKSIPLAHEIDFWTS